MDVRDLDVFDYRYDEDTNAIELNLLGSVYGASIEDYPEVMSRVINILQEVPEADTVILTESRDYEYDDDQVEMLREIANSIKDISAEGNLSQNPGKQCDSFYSEHLPEVQRIVVDQLRKDPVGAYVELKRMRRHLKQEQENSYERKGRCIKYFFQDVVDPVMEELEDTTIVQRAYDNDYITGHHVGDREVYREFFHPLVRPNFMLTKFMSLPPERGEEIDHYTVRNSIEVSIYEVPDQIQPVYHVDAPEFKLPEEKYRVLDAARRFMASHEPESGEFARPERMRNVFSNIGRDMLRDISQQMEIPLSREELTDLTQILNRYTSGLGVLELLLSDPQIQDVFVNSPIGESEIFVKHQEYEECRTNLIPTKEEAESWATRFRIQSGRPLDEANPILDTEAEVPGGRARVAIIQENLSPEGLAFAFRRHRSKAWTLPLFINNGMINTLGAALVSFIVDGNRSMLFSGTRGAGKSSFLGASMLEIMQKHRIVTVEDSVTADTSLVYKEDANIKFGDIGDLVDEKLEYYGSEHRKDNRDVVRNIPESIEVLSMSRHGDLRWSEANFFMRHEVEKPIYEVETRTGRKIKVTKDHSLFTMGENGKISEVKPTELDKDSYVVTPRELDIPGEEKQWNLLDKAGELQGYFKGAECSNRKRLEKLAEKHGYSEHTANYWIRENILPAKIVADLEKEFDAEELEYKHKRQSHTVPALIELDREMMQFLGLWIADGCYDNRTVIITVSDRKCREVVRSTFEKLGLPVKHHSDEHSLMVNSKVLKEVMKVHGFTGDAYTKRLPEWVFASSKTQRRDFLKGLYSGDGYSTEDEIGIDLINENLIEDIQTILLTEGIRGRARDSGKMRSMRISDLEGLRKFKNRIGFIQDYKNENTDLEGRSSTHDTTDIVPLPRNALENYCERPEVVGHDYLDRGNQVGRQKLKETVKKSEKDELEVYAESDIFWDQVKSVEKVSEQEEVYDISVPGDENFVAGNMLAHNTLELPISQMKDLGYNIERMKSRSVITQVENEMPADEAIRTSLRLGDSALVIGEVRSDEAQTLYEAMRVGAVANFVGGTIHGESAYSVFDRVVNDLGVPRTSFKATDVIVSVNKIRSPDGTETYRRITGITEVRKDWKEDPSEENGFVDLMRYDSNEDELIPTDTLLNGESMVLNRIAENIREWKNDWDAVWENIQLRKKMKKKIVEEARKRENTDILEADMVVDSNQKFHELASKVREEYGEQDTDRIYARWNEWFQRRLEKEAS